MKNPFIDFKKAMIRSCCSMLQNKLMLQHLINHFPMSFGVSELATEREPMNEHSRVHK